MSQMPDDGQSGFQEALLSQSKNLLVIIQMSLIMKPVEPTLKGFKLKPLSGKLRLDTYEEFDPIYAYFSLKFPIATKSGSLFSNRFFESALLYIKSVLKTKE